MGRILLNTERRLDITNSICDKLYEWFGDITYITGVRDKKISCVYILITEK